MRPIYLSPHLDDAALSCGGWIHSQVSHGARPLVISCCAGVPDYQDLSAFAQGQHQRWQDLRHPVETRRHEDIRAMAHLGADYVHWEYLDCIYRRGSDGGFLYQSDDAIFGAVHGEDAPLVNSLVARLLPLLDTTEVPIYAPLGVGNHVDHQLVRQAALHLRDEGFHVELYEDYPYAGDPLRLRQVVDSWQAAPFPIVRPLSVANLEAKVSAVCAYASQLTTLFGEAGAAAERVREYTTRVGGGTALAERYWLGGQR